MCMQCIFHIRSEIVRKAMNVAGLQGVLPTFVHCVCVLPRVAKYRSTWVSSEMDMEAYRTSEFFPRFESATLANAPSQFSTPIRNIRKLELFFMPANLLYSINDYISHLKLKNLVRYINYARSLRNSGDHQRQAARHAGSTWMGDRLAKIDL